jgi:hypothetical protein
MVTSQERLNNDAQLKHIDRLNADVRRFQKEIERLRTVADKNKLYHDYWQSIIDACEKSEIVQNEFCRFMVAVKLCIDEPVEGLTVPHKQEDDIQWLPF